MATILIPILAAFVGGGISAGTTFLVAWQNARNARRTVAEQRRSQEKLATMRTNVRLMRLANTLRGLEAQIEAGCERGVAAGVDVTQPFSYLLPVKIDDAAFIGFEVDDLVVFIEAKAGKFLSRLILLGDRYNGLLEGIRAYGDQRHAFFSQLPAVMNGTSGSPIMTKEEFLRAGPQIANLNVLAGHIIDDVPELKVEAMALLAELVPLVRGYFGDQDFLVPLPSDDPLPPIGDSRSQA